MKSCPLPLLLPYSVFMYLRTGAEDSRVIDTYCSPDLEAMSVQCRPFYLPQELTAAFVTAVYIPPGTNVSMALGQLQLIVAKQQRAHPDGVHIIAGDFYSPPALFSLKFTPLLLLF